jgi:phage-related holin
MESLKSFIAVSLAAILAYFEPVQHVLAAMLLLFALNFIFGLVADLVSSRNFSFRKAFSCIREASVFLLVLASVYFIGDHLEAKAEALQMISTIAYALVYFYSVNICKNLRQIFPKSKPIVLIYDLLSIEILSKLPKTIHFQKKDHDANLA